MYNVYKVDRMVDNDMKIKLKTESDKQTTMLKSFRTNELAKNHRERMGELLEKIQNLER